MTSKQKAIKEANKMADKEILKSQLKNLKASIKDWLGVKVYGYKRGTILVAALIIVAAVLSV